jgi:hypothetical protein
VAGADRGAGRDFRGGARRAREAERGKHRDEREECGERSTEKLHAGPFDCPGGSPKALRAGWTHVPGRVQICLDAFRRGRSALSLGAPRLCLTATVIGVPRNPSLAEDSTRNAELLLGERLPSAAVPRPLRGFSVPPLPVRVGQRLAMKADRLDWQSGWLEPLLAARRERLGSSAAGPPRLLVRVDEFPYFDAFDVPAHGNDAGRRFNEVMAEAGVQHLIGVNANLTRDALDPEAEGGRPLGEGEIAVLDEMRASGVVTFGQHGTSHRTRYRSPRRRSEFVGLAPTELADVLDRGRAALASVGIEPRVIVPPYNRFEAAQWPVFAERFDVICGGTESIALMGFQGGPKWHRGSIYLPCYAPLYGTAREILPALERLLELAPGTWVPIALHSMWEVEDDFRALARLAARMAEFAVDWNELFAVVDRTRAGAAA